MDDAGLTSFIVAYIGKRKQLKLEALDKEAGRQDSADASEAQRLAQARQDIEARYQVASWLTDAASRAGQIRLVTHALKFTHSDARGSSVFSSSRAENAAEYLSTASLPHPAIDAVGNAAALDVARLLQTEHQGDSLVAALQRDDYSSLAPLADNESQLAHWVAGFKQVLTDENPSSHKLAKQIYFPIAKDQYHLLSPLYSSSLAQALYQRINASRFSEEAKAVREARKNNHWHDDVYTVYPHLAVQNMGGTKPQNISFLNNARVGKSFLLPCAPPAWKSIAKPPQTHQSIFSDHLEFSYLARPAVRQMQQFLLSVKHVANNADIRNQRLAYTDEIIDILFNYVSVIQNMTAGWSSPSCALKPAQQLWLDPYRSQTDEAFKFAREGGDWKKEVARDFGFWLNRQLDSDQLTFGAVELREWATAELFRRRMREFEQGLAEEVK